MSSNVCIYVWFYRHGWWNRSRESWVDHLLLVWRTAQDCDCSCPRRQDPVTGSKRGVPRYRDSHQTGHFQWLDIHPEECRILRTKHLWNIDMKWGQEVRSLSFFGSAAVVLGFWPPLWDDHPQHSNHFRDIIFVWRVVANNKKFNL